MSTSAIYRCEDCGAEAVELGDWTAAEQAAWDAEHTACTGTPASREWDRLAESVTGTYIWHDGDASKVHPRPRPSWSSKDLDIIHGRVSAYSSETVTVPLSRLDAVNVPSGDKKHLLMRRSRVEVSAQDLSTRGLGCGVAITQYVKGTPETYEISMTLDEARTLADVLHAAVALAESGINQ